MKQYLNCIQFENDQRRNHKANAMLKFDIHLGETTLILNGVSWQYVCSNLV